MNLDTHGPGKGVPSLAGELQQLVDAWASRLQRSVSIDDMEMRLLAASAHYGDEDPARIRAVLGRGLDPETINYLVASEIRSREEPGWVPGVPELGLKTRLFVPVRCNGLTLGQLYLIDPEESAEEETITLAKQAAAAAGLLLYRQLVLHEWERKRDEAVLRDLFAADDPARERAIREINESGLLGFDKQVVVLVVRPRQTDSDLSRAGRAIASALDKVMRTERPGTTLMMTSGHQGVLLVATDSSAEVVTTRLTTALAKELSTGQNPEQAQEFILGLSSVVLGLSEANTAYEQAIITARAGALLPDMGDIVRWNDLGIYAVLMRLPIEDLRTHVRSSAVARLTEPGDEGGLAYTAETFLDCAGDSRRTAEALHIHRSTLYYRLEKIKQITGLDLHNGGDRLVLHLGLKAQRLVSATPYRSVS